MAPWLHRYKNCIKHKKKKNPNISFIMLHAAGGQATLTIPGTNITIPIGTPGNLNAQQAAAAAANNQVQQQVGQQQQAQAHQQQAQQHAQQQQTHQQTTITIPGTNIQIPTSSVTNANAAANAVLTANANSQANNLGALKVEGSGTGKFNHYVLCSGFIF